MKVEPRLPPSQFLPHLNTIPEGITFNMNLERTSHIQTVVILYLFHLAIYATPLELAIPKLDRKVYSRNPMLHVSHSLIQIFYKQHPNGYSSTVPDTFV